MIKVTAITITLVFLNELPMAASA